MCGACESDHGRRWTSARLTVIVFVSALIALSVAGVVSRVRVSDSQAPAPCVAASEAAVRFQSAVTRDLRDHTRLHADTDRLLSELRSLGANDCPATRRFLRSAETTIGTLCEDCAAEFRRLRPAAA